MRIGVLIPTRGIVMQSARRPPVDECWAMATHADRAGYDAVWVGDSVVATPRLEPLTTLAYLAAMTTRVRLGTAVLLPALRHPVVLAHQIANVDQLSRGRVVLGLGVGWSLPSAEREWAACGMDHKRRVRRLEEHVEVWRMLWSGVPVTYSGHALELVDPTIGPLPWTPAGPPVLITAGNRGELLPAQFERFARLGDGIITTYLHAEECRVVRERAEEALARHGRSLPGFPLCAYPPRLATLDAEAFLRRFLLHLLPDRFVRIRHYGWLAHSARKRLLPKVQELLAPSATLAAPARPAAPEPWEATLLRLTGMDVTRCPCCGAGGFLIIETVPATAEPRHLPLPVRSP